jgi:urease accessory protein UreE
VEAYVLALAHTRTHTESALASRCYELGYRHSELLRSRSLEREEEPGGVVLYINGAPCDSVGKRLNGAPENNVSSQVRSEKQCKSSM